MDVVDAWAMGRPDQQVVGESYYEDALRQVVARLGGGSTGEVMTRAVLVPEPDNRFDRNAVAVTIDGAKVGHLPREDAVRFSRELQHLAGQGHYVGVPARLWWMDQSDGDWRASVSLTLSEPGLLLPANAPPIGPAHELPVGAPIQVTGEEAHLGTLASVIGRDGRVAIYATLHEISDDGSRRRRAVVEVRLDGAPVGRLSPTMSDHLLPCIRHAQAHGVALYCRAQARGNALKADVELYAARSVDVPQAWIDELTRKATPHGAATASQQQAGAAVSPGHHEPAIPSQPPLPPPGWYAKPSGTGVRWWDGTTWTIHTHET